VEIISIKSINLFKLFIFKLYHRGKVIQSDLK